MKGKIEKDKEKVWLSDYRYPFREQRHSYKARTGGSITVPTRPPRKHSRKTMMMSHATLRAGMNG